MSLGPIRIRLRSFIPGRERWEAACIRHRPRLAQMVEGSLLAIRGMLQVEANPITGRILVLYDPAVLEGKVETELRRVLDECLRDELPREDARPWLADSPIVQIVQHSVQEKGLLVRAAGWSAAATLVGFLPIWGLSSLLSVAKATASEGTGKSRLWLLGFLTALANGGEWYIKHRQRNLWRQFASQAEHELRTRAFAHVESLDMAFFDRQGTGQLMSILSADISSVGRFLETGPSNAIQAVVTATLSLLTIAAVAPSLALMVALPAGLVVLTARFFQRQIAPLYSRFGADSAELNRQLANCLAGIATIKSFTAEQQEAERTREISDRRRTSYGRAIAASSRNASFVHGAAYTTVSAITVTTGAVAVYQGSLPAKSFQAVTQLVPKFFGAISQIDDIFESYLNAGRAARRVLNLLDVQPTIPDGGHHALQQEVRGEISFRDVKFHYVPEIEVLRDISLDIGPGEVVGIVGATGAGKTTIAKLLLRFYEVNGGVLAVDGTDVRELPLQALRRSIAFVSQDIYLFDGTVRENIAYGRPDATLDEVILAARAAEAHDFIMHLPKGYDSQVGERGQLLSMGQRQRISIARAVIKNAPILILDEATASVDNETEAAILRSIDTVAVGRSMIVIAHRLSTVRNSARIYVIDEGLVVEKGTHDELLALGGLYASLWNVQTGHRTPGG